MRRRDAIKAIVGSSVGWPLAAHSQQPTVAKRVGVLMGTAESDPDQKALVSIFSQALAELGWKEGVNLHIEYRWAAGDADRLKTLSAELARLTPDAIFGQGTPVTTALRQAAPTTPVVFVNVSDPVSTGLVSSFAHPGGNITGLTNYEFSMGGKWLEILKETSPNIRRVAVIYNPDNPSKDSEWTPPCAHAHAPAREKSLKNFASCSNRRPRPPRPRRMPEAAVHCLAWKSTRENPRGLGAVMWDGGYTDIVIRLFLFRPDPRRMQSRLEPRSFVFHVCLCPTRQCGVTPLYAAPTDPGAKLLDHFSRARVGALFRDPLRPTLSPAAQRKRNDERWESMSVAAASPCNQHFRSWRVAQAASPQMPYIE